MANVPQTSQLIVIAQNYAGGIVRQINRTAVLLKLLAPTFREAVGANAAWVAEGDGAVAETFAEGASPANFGSDSQSSATIPLARYWSPFNVTGTAMMVSRSARTPAGNIELWARNIVNGCEKLAKLLDTDMYTGAGGNAFVGLDAAIGNLTNTYATIDRTVGANSYWLPTVTDSANAAVTFKNIRDDLAAIKVASGYKPDVAMVSPATLNKLAALYDPLKQYVFQTNVADVVVASGTKIELDGGVGAIRFDGCTFIEDVWCPANAIYYVNTRYIHVEYGDAEASIPMGAGDEDIMLGGLTDGFDTIPMNMVLQLLARTGDAQSAMLKCYPQLVVERPNSMGKRINLG